MALGLPALSADHVGDDLADLLKQPVGQIRSCCQLPVHPHLSPLGDLGFLTHDAIVVGVSSHPGPVIDRYSMHFIQAIHTVQPIHSDDLICRNRIWGLIASR